MDGIVYKKEGGRIAPLFFINFIPLSYNEVMLFKPES